jgi:hypothetical protein
VVRRGCAGNVRAVPLPSLAARPPRQRFLIGTAIVALCTVALIAILSAAGLAQWDHGARPPHALSVPLGSQRRASLAVLSGAASVTVTTAPLPGELLRASTPAGSGSVPGLAVTGSAVRLTLRGSGAPGGPATIRVTLSSRVAWRLTLAGGASQTRVLLGGGRLRGADFTAGSSQITMRLPRPAGTVRIVLAGGASEVRVAVPASVPARLRLDDGAGSATLDGQARSGVAGGTVLTGPGWSAAADRYDIDAASGVSVISVASG